MTFSVRVYHVQFMLFKLIMAFYVGTLAPKSR
jgi:hypothetical protein